MKINIKNIEKGSMLVMAIVFTTIFVMLFSSLLKYLLMQFQWVDQNTEQERALQIAEAGIEYYRWHLAHYPSDLTDGTGTTGPYIHVYEDPENGPVGEYSLEIGGEILCGEVQIVQATSTGWTYKNPNIKRTIVVKIARPTVADYSYIVDSNVWAGSSRTIIGPYHTNGVVRMDGDNHSAVTSKINTADCGPTGLGNCGSYWNDINGVYGSGSNPQWWSWGQPEIPFTNFDYDFGQMEAKAISDGIYLPKISNDTSLFGYYLELQDDRTVDIYRVNSVWRWVTSKTPASQDISFPELADNMSTYRTFLRTENIPQDCPLIYVSDRTWLEGIVSGKVTIVANDTGVASPDLFLQDNITYETGGIDGLTVLAERNLLIPLYVPDNMTISGIFFAQKGAYGRNYYPDVSPYNTYREQHSLTTNGTVVSKLRTGTQWGTTQGFENRYDNFDRNLAKSPPPMTPFTSPIFRFIEWKEI
jgi:hypothetical protein